MTFRHILVGWDGSDAADAALRVAMAYTQEAGGEVEALAVFSRAGSSSGSGEQAPDPERRDVLEKFARLFDGGPVRLHAVVEAASPARVLARFADEHSFDLIVVGRRSGGRDGDGTLHELASHAASPLLVVGPDGPGDRGDSAASVADVSSTTPDIRRA